MQVTLTPEQELLSVVSLSNFTGTSEGVFSQFPDIVIDAATVHQHLNAEPFYWKLPDQFQGNQVKVYFSVFSVHSKIIKIFYTFVF